MGDLNEFNRVESNKNQELLDTKLDSRKTHLMKIISIIPLPYYFGWLIFGGVFFLIHLFILLFFEGSLVYIELSTILFILIALQGIVITWAHNKLKFFKNTLTDFVELPKDEISGWHDKWMSKIFSDRKMIISGLIIVGLNHALNITFFHLSFDSIFSYISFEAMCIAASYVEGTGLFVMLMTAFMVHDIGELPLKISVLQRSKIQDVGLLYSKFTICASSVYVTWTIFHILCPSRFSSFQTVLWFASFALLLIAYFILPQYSIHKIMTETKKEKLSTFSSYLRIFLDETFNSPTKENVFLLKNMLDIQMQLDKMSEWPFGSYELIHIACIIIIPLIVVTMEVIFGVIK